MDLMIRVHDTGIGMNHEFITRIFRPLEQESMERQRYYVQSGSLIGKDAFSDAGRVKTLVLPQSADVTLEKAGFFGKGVHDRKMWLKLRYAPIAYVCKN